MRSPTRPFRRIRPLRVTPKPFNFTEPTLTDGQLLEIHDTFGGHRVLRARRRKGFESARQQRTRIRRERRRVAA